MGRVLGLDSGGTKTDLAVVDRTGAVLHRRRAPGLDPMGPRDWEADLTALAQEAGPVGQAVLGLPCHGEVEAISARQIAVAQRLFGVGALVLNDVEVAFDGAFAGQEGVLILAGTGSMAWARGPLGSLRVGGWSDLFGDEGSAFWIGREALSRATQELDGRREAGGLAAALAARLGLAAEGLAPWALTLAEPRPGIAALAAHVSALAQAGLPGAVEILTEAAHHLARHGEAAARRSGAWTRWSFAGGVMADPLVRRLLAERMGQPPALPRLPPIGGAVLRAAIRAGWTTDDAFLSRLTAGLQSTEPRPEAGQTTPG